MRIAVIGSGISGLVVANKLSRSHAVTVFEAEDRLGGHTATQDVHLDGRNYQIDTGFIVYNDHTYPEFIRLLGELGVTTQQTTMGFSVSCETTGLEYSGAGLNSLFAQRRNLISPYFFRLVRDIVRFNREAVADFDSDRLANNQTLQAYLHAGNYSPGFIDHYLAPMASAIWSSSTQAVLQFPVVFFVRFFKNHGLLQLRNRPQWHTIVGGSREYIAPLSKNFANQVRLSCPVEAVLRTADEVCVFSPRYGEERFDQVVFATHSDQALNLLRDPSQLEQEILAAIPYVSNSVVLHTDDSLLPELRSTWSSWNYRLTGDSEKPILTYNMNILQRIESPHTFCVTLNHDDAIAADKILARFNYSHPEFSAPGIRAQQRWHEINGVNRTWFCGAYWRNGFHEDGVVSALKVVDGMTGGVGVV